MKFIISNLEINEAVKKMGRILTAKTQLPILAGVLVEAKSDCILFTASDGTESIIHRVLLSADEVQVEEEGKTVFSKETFDVARKLKGNITFEATENNLTVSMDKTALEFSVMDAEEYPPVAVESNSNPLILTGPVFSDLVSKTTFATAKSETRPILQAVNISFGNDSNVMVATDSHRLSRIVMENTHKGESSSVSVPASVLDQAMKSFDLTKDVMIFPNEQAISLVNGSTILSSTLLQGNYPDTSRLIPTDFQTNLVVNRQELIDGLELLQTISTNKVVDLTVNGLFVELRAKGTGTKGMKELVFETYDGEENFSLSFSAQYVLEALKRSDESSIRLRFNGNNKPFVIVSVHDDSNDLHLVLPVRQ